MVIFYLLVKRCFFLLPPQKRGAQSPQQRWILAFARITGGLGIRRGNENGVYMNTGFPLARE